MAALRHSFECWCVATDVGVCSSLGSGQGSNHPSGRVGRASLWRWTILFNVTGLETRSKHLSRSWKISRICFQGRWLLITLVILPIPLRLHFSVIEGLESAISQAVANAEFLAPPSSTASVFFTTNSRWLDIIWLYLWFMSGTFFPNQRYQRLFTPNKQVRIIAPFFCVPISFRFSLFYAFLCDFIPFFYDLFYTWSRNVQRETNTWGAWVCEI